MSTCKSCGQRITWLETAGGKMIPVDEDPVPDGNIVCVSGKIAKIMRKDELLALGPDVPRYVSHFATCPQAGEWRGRG